MENSIAVSPAVPMPASSANVTTTAVKAKKPRNTIAKASADEARKLPGAIVPVAKKVEMGFIYSILFGFPDTALGWSAVEANKVHAFASQLDMQATAKGLGGVTSVSIADGSYDVTLTLAVNGKPASDVDPAAKVLSECEDFLSTVAGTPYKAKVNGTTIAKGVVPASNNLAA